METRDSQSAGSEPIVKSVSLDKGSSSASDAAASWSRPAVRRFGLEQTLTLVGSQPPAY